MSGSELSPISRPQSPCIRSPLATEHSSSTTSLPSLTRDAAVYRHSKYYIKEDMVVFQVENCLYKAHQYFFIWESDFFKDLFSLPRPVAADAFQPAEGTTDETAIPLPDVTCAEFEALLDFFYFRQSTQEEAFTIERWSALLSISTRFQFDKIRARAIKEISDHATISPVDKVILADKYSVTEWLCPAYCSICEREEPLTDSEALKLGAVTTARLARARETIRNNNVGSRTPDHGGRVPVQSARSETPGRASATTDIVEGIFWPKQPGKAGGRGKGSSKNNNWSANWGG